MQRGSVLKPRPCKICRRRFPPHPRLKERQKTCGDPECHDNGTGGGLHFWSCCKALQIFFSLVEPVAYQFELWMMASAVSDDNNYLIGCWRCQSFFSVIDFYLKSFDSILLTLFSSTAYASCCGFRLFMIWRKAMQKGHSKMPM